MGEMVFTQVVSVGCGLDVHKDLIVATIQKGNDQIETKEFNAYTSSLKSLRDWCKAEKVTHIAMESTGVYWKPVFNVLEEDFEILLVNARHVKNVPGHKTDKKDSRWLSKLLLSGLLKGSFIPPCEIRELRDLVRYRKKVVEQASSEKNRIIKILEDANIKLSSVLSDVDGVVGTKIINSLIEGKTDIDGLMKFYHGKIKTGKEEFRLALEGRISKHHRFMLQLHKDSIAEKERLIERIDAEIDEATKAYQVEISLLQTIPGVAKVSAINIISETGVDMGRFPDETHLSSWAGMSPGNNETGGKKKLQERSMATNTYKAH
jgi:transposase